MLHFEVLLHYNFLVSSFGYYGHVNQVRQNEKNQIMAGAKEIKVCKCLNFFHCLKYHFWHDIIVYFPADTKVSQSRRKNVLFLVSQTSQIGLKWKSRRSFFKTSSRRRPETSSRPFPGDVLKTFSKRRPKDLFQETSLRRLRLHQDFFQQKQKTTWRLFMDFLSTF